jgi:mRNA-degrading endonuclease RelE of RelBE toxin-antitoxin system
MVNISTEAKQNLKGFDLKTREEILDKIEEKLEKNRDQDSISYIHKPDFGIEFHRLKLTNNGLNHRIYFDYQNSEPLIFAVRHRDHAYSPEDLKEVETRLQELERD